MKKSLFVAAVAALALVSCGGDKKVEEKAENKDAVEAPVDTTATAPKTEEVKPEEAKKEDAKEGDAKVEEAKKEEAPKAEEAKK